MNMRPLFLLATLTVLLVSTCNKKVVTGSDTNELVKVSKASRVIKALEDNAFDTEYLEGRANVKLESEKLNIGGNAVIRLQKDKAIWVSVKKFGFEGARALIRPDSFFVLNRLNGDYTAEPLSFIEEKYQIPARFDLLQEIVLGNAVFFNRDLELAQDGDIYTLAGRDQRYATRHTVDGRGFQLLGMELTELAQNRQLIIRNADFRPAPGKEDQPAFAFTRTVEIEAAATGPAKLDLSFSSLSFSGPLPMPFARR